MAAGISRNRTSAPRGAWRGIAPRALPNPTGDAMPGKSFAGILVLLATMGPDVMAGTIGPAWAENVTVQATPDPDGPGLVTNAWGSPSNSDAFGLCYTYNRYDGAYSSAGVLLDYQGTGSSTIDITDSFLSDGFSGSVPLYVSVFAGSPEPYVPELLNAFPTCQYSVPTGDDPASPFVMSISLDVNGPVALFLTTGLSPDYDTYDGVASYITLSVVPEPSGAAMLPVGIGFAIVYAFKRKKKRPGSKCVS
jgi:hypothetical protein